MGPFAGFLGAFWGFWRHGGESQIAGRRFFLGRVVFEVCRGRFLASESAVLGLFSCILECVEHGQLYFGRFVR